MKKIILTFLFVVSLVSCTKESVATDVSLLQRGGFAQFEKAPVQTAALANGYYEANIIDANNNLVEYKIISVEANIGGVKYPAVPVNYKYSLPTKIRLNFADLANLFGLTKDDVHYGDSFNVIAQVTTADGRTYKGIASDGVDLSLNTNAALLNTGNNYRSAMNFKFTVACPKYDEASMIGDYLVTQDEFDEYSTRVSGGYLVKCVLGPRPNTLRFINFSNVGTDLIVNVNPDAQSVTSEKVKIYSNFYTYGDCFAEGTGGLVFSCNNTIDLSLKYSVNAGTFTGSFHFVMTKQ